jgi:hypothetical protein
MKAVIVVNSDASVVKEFEGATAADDAVAYVATLPGAADGRYGIDISDAKCKACGAEFWHEAWDDTPEGWACPKCGEVGP